MERAHPPLRRVLRSSPQRVDPTLRISPVSMLLSDSTSTSSLSSAISPSSSSSVTSESSSCIGHVGNSSMPSGNTLKLSNTVMMMPMTSSAATCWPGTLDHQQQQLENDSCYSSCSEESHSSLSRESSDGLSSNLYQLTLDEGVTSDNLVQADIPVEILTFARNLGYSEDQLMTVLQKVGTDAGQDRILSELVNVGKHTTDIRSRSRSRLLRDDNSLASSISPSSCPTSGQQQNVASGNLSSNNQNEQGSSLRSIVIDGSNIAMSHGRKEVFSCAGIRDCVQFFVDRGHTDILVFIPQFRREAARADCPITDQHVLSELDGQGRIVWTPSRRVNGRRIVCHDDRYILKTADEKDAVVVSNDEYRDLVRENPHFLKLVENRLLMYSFVDGKFMPPDDPLGRHGPTLDQFLSKNNSASGTQLCPYARKCTYGNKCKYFHPERPNGVHVSVTDRLIKEKNQKKTLMMGRSMQIGAFKSHHMPVARSQSLNMQLGNVLNQENTQASRPVQTVPYHQPWHAAVGRNQSMPIPYRYNHKEGQEKSVYHMQYNLYSPSTAVWGHSELSVGPLSTNPQTCTSTKDQERAKVQYNLCQIFPEAVVVSVMAAHPDETCSQVLCEQILAMNKGFSGN